MSDTIFITDLEFIAIVGVLDFERVTPQPLRLDLEFTRSFDEAARSDDVASTTNYAEVLDIVERCVVEGQFFLLETLARDVARVILNSDDVIECVTVSVAKRTPPVSQRVREVGVRTTVTRPS